MFNLFFRPYVPGFRVGTDGVPGFNIDDDGLPWRATASFDDTLPDPAAQRISRRGANTDPAQHQLQSARSGGLGPIGSADRLARVSRQSTGRCPWLQCWAAG